MRSAPGFVTRECRRGRKIFPSPIYGRLRRFFHEWRSCRPRCRTTGRNRRERLPPRPKKDTSITTTANTKSPGYCWGGEKKFDCGKCLGFLLGALEVVGRQKRRF